MIKIVCASHRPEILSRNLLQSEIDLNGIFIQTGFRNIPKAYNDVIEQHAGNYEEIVYVHEDVYITHQASCILKPDVPDNWAVLGLAGVDFINGQRSYIGNIRDRGKEWGSHLSEPAKAQTVDELLFIVNHRYDLKFDEQFPLDFYGADICMQAHEKGLGVYVIPGYVHHNSTRAFGARTPSFYESEAKFKKKWAHRLPIATTCSIMLPE